MQVYIDFFKESGADIWLIQKNVVILRPKATLEGNMSCEKYFAKVLSKGRFLTY
jgi:hypothetical protein